MNERCAQYAKSLESHSKRSVIGEWGHPETVQI
jgi:hypothetical protein